MPPYQHNVSEFATVLRGCHMKIPCFPLNALGLEAKYMTSLDTPLANTNHMALKLQGGLKA